MPEPVGRYALKVAPGTDRWTDIQRGRITSSFVSDVLAIEAGDRSDRMALQYCLAADLRGTKRPPRADAKITDRLHFIEREHTRRRDVATTTQAIVSAIGTAKMEGATVVNDVFVTHPAHDWLGCFPDLFACRFAPDFAPVFGVSIFRYGVRHAYVEAVTNGTWHSRKHYDKVQYCLLVTQSPAWYSLHVYDDKDDGQRHEYLRMEHLNPGRGNEIYTACLRFYLDCAQRALRG